MVLSSREVECLNKLKGWRLHFAWLRLAGRDHVGSDRNLKGCPTLCHGVRKIWTPITLADEAQIDAACRDVLLVCYAPVKQAREVAAKSHLGTMVHMTQAFRFVMERAFLPEEDL